MSLLTEKTSLDPRQYKYLFLASYFDLADYDNLSAESLPFIAHYIQNRFNKLNENALLNFLDYMASMKLRNIILDRNINMFTHIKPHFKYICQKNNLDILLFDDKVYVQPNTPIYATNFFVKDPSKFRVIMYSEFSKVFNDRHFVNNSETFCMMNGNMGYIFDDAYVDWCGVRMCSVPKVKSAEFPYRLYLVGDLMAKHFIDNNIAFINENDYVLKNFHKGLPLFKNNYRIINSKKFVTNKPNVMFDEIRTELNTKTAYIRFIQRDYIYDADFPDDLLEILNDYMTDTAIYKFVRRFKTNTNEQINYNPYNEIVIDRYAVNKYRKLNIKTESNTRFPSLRIDEPAYLLIRDDIIQIKGTMNAFYVPQKGVFVILAKNSLFGSTELLHYTPDLIPYTHNSPPKRLLSTTYVIDKSQKLYLTEYTFDETVPAYLLIRGDYESSFKSLGELEDIWVKNTLLKLLITPQFVERTLELVDYNLRSKF
ncbi:p49 [Erannis ankeraria nucleopolyhedrovirus]|uniref:p49 n=1 Tax=Erannis ankeraria nucleopolyhedrovirus TaxID=2913600 RepID=UPI002481E6B4|nr:p49 [Erannis ankeraria nucleopolyhedrovirus]UJZ88961.1 p49 [Erannis ankeraria nucleopolyhedrovirus]